jgi:hypothetical protein
MLGNEAQGATTTVLLAPASAANTAAATSSWTDVRYAEGDLMFIVQTGIITGTCTWTFEHATDGSGTGSAAIVPNEGALTVVTTSNDPITEKRTIAASAVGGWVRVVGTIVTGPALCSASVTYRPKTI